MRQLASPKLLLRMVAEKIGNGFSKFRGMALKMQTKRFHRWVERCANVHAHARVSVPAKPNSTPPQIKDLAL